MIVTEYGNGRLAVAQQSHAEMCGELARGWGNEDFELPKAAGDLVCAAAGHELGMLEWDREPSLDPESGLPASVLRMDPAEHLPLRRLSPDRLAERSPYAALLCSLHHTSFYRQPHRLARLRRRHRLVHGYLADEAERQRELQDRLEPDPAALERDWRLLRAIDGISHALLLDRAPTRVERVPRRTGDLTAISISKAAEALVLDPWPFATDELVVGADGRLLTDTYEERAEMLAALAAAPVIELRYRLVRG